MKLVLRCRYFFVDTITVLLLSLFLSCSENSTPEEDPDLLLCLDFDKQATSFDTETGHIYNDGIEGKCLDVGMSTSIASIKEPDKGWFSNDRNFSVSLWLKSDHNSPDTTIVISNSDFSKRPAGIYGNRRTNKGFTLYSHNGGWGWNIGNGSLHYLYAPIASDQPIADNKWHQIVFTYNSILKEVRLFYDGINKAVLHIGDFDDNFFSHLPLRIGEDLKASPGYSSFKGMIDEIQVWKSVLSPEEVKQRFGKYSTIKKEPVMDGDEITVVNWNIWHGGTHFTKEKDGFDGIERIIELIGKAGADIVLMQETYGAGSLISSNLGFYYYEASSTIGAVWGANLSVMSRFPIDDAFMIEQKSNYGNNYAFNNGGVKIRLSDQKSVIAFTNWYNGRKPEDLDGALKGWSTLIDKSDNTPIIWAGDFNSASHLDDGEGKSGHSKLMEQAGFVDSFRKLFPDAKRHPGYTAGRFQDRIDYIYFKGGKLELMEAGPIDPNFRGKEELTPGYPSDHLGLVAKFKIR